MMFASHGVHLRRMYTNYAQQKGWSAKRVGFTEGGGWGGRKDGDGEGRCENVGMKHHDHHETRSSPNGLL